MVTTSLKVRRNVVDNRYRDLWESLYDADEAPRG
jgi:long-chain acyl-CoA synthetase